MRRRRSRLRDRRAGPIPATVAIDGAKNAGILAAQILGAGDPSLLDRVARYKRDLDAMVMGKVAKMESGELG